jgi:hypothetical protein
MQDLQQSIQEPMTDQKNTLRAQEAVSWRSHEEILLDDEWDVIYWCLVLKCTKSELEAAVRRFGKSSSVIRELIGKDHLSN